MRHQRAVIIASAACVAGFMGAGAFGKAAIPGFVLVMGFFLMAMGKPTHGALEEALPTSLSANYLSFLMELAILDAGFSWALEIGFGPGAVEAPFAKFLAEPSAALALATLAGAIVVGDFVGYWRHRLEHSRWLWPAHEFHHGDEEMNWSTTYRFHPLNRASTTAIDMGALAALGFPWWAVVGNAVARHLYGLLIHANIDWDYGGWGGIFVSPSMHRWHHADDAVAVDKNFATFFSVFDRMFGTFYAPGRRADKTGLADGSGQDFWRSLAHPIAKILDRATARTRGLDI